MARNNGGSTSEQITNVAERVETLRQLTSTKLTEPPEGVGTSDAAIFKHLESIAERAVLAHIQPLQTLVERANELIRWQLSHLSRFKLETQTMLRNGERVNGLAKMIEDELQNIRSEHADIINAKVE